MTHTKKNEAPKTELNVVEQSVAVVAAEPETKVVVERLPCLCGCNKTPVGRKSRYIPGHDARHAAMLAGGLKHQPRPCSCECGGLTKGGRFLPGHDAKLHSMQINATKEATKGQTEVLAQAA